MKNQNASYQLVRTDADEESKNAKDTSQNGKEGGRELEADETWVENEDVEALKSRSISDGGSIDFSEDRSRRFCFYLRLHQNWIPDAPLTLSTNSGPVNSHDELEDEVDVAAPSGQQTKPMVILDLFLVKFLKFVIMTTAMVLLSHFLVKTHWLEWEKDPRHTIANLILYDGTSVVMDMFVFFCVARLYREQGIDTLAFFIPAVFGTVYPSFANVLYFMKHSVSLYEIHCDWPWQLWIFVMCIIPLAIFIVYAHIQYSIRKRILLQKLVELGLAIMVGILPYASNPNFHLHHWYFGWLLGMHCNLNVWWSRCTMAFLWGFYANGIAVWGRDPILTCAVAFYRSTDQECPFMDGYQPGEQVTDDDGSDYKEMEQPDWRTCTGYIP
jgi:hypothetical protein